MGTVTPTDALAIRDLDQIAHRAWYWRSQTGDGGYTFSEAPNEIASQLKASERAFKSLIRAIEREGFEVMHDLTDYTYSVRKRT